MSNNTIPTFFISDCDVPKNFRLVNQDQWVKSYHKWLNHSSGKWSFTTYKSNEIKNDGRVFYITPANWKGWLSIIFPYIWREIKSTFGNE